MNTKSSSILDKTVTILVFLVIAWIALELFATSYSYGIVFLLSLLFVWLGKVAFRSIISKIGWIRKGFALGILLSIYGLFVFYILLPSLRSPSAQQLRFPSPFKDYIVRIETADFASGQFDVAASVIYNASIDNPFFYFIELGATDGFETQLIELPGEQMHGTANEGFLSRSVIIPGPEGRQVTLVSSSGLTRTVTICGYGCPNIKVELIDFPKRAFYQAKYAQDLKVFEFGNTMSASWTIFDFDYNRVDIAFNYVPAPFNFFMPMLNPLVGISSPIEWILVVIGLIGSVFLMVIAKPALDAIKKASEKWFEGKLKKTPPETATLIISSKGEEKEIKIRKR